MIGHNDSLTVSWCALNSSNRTKREGHIEFCKNGECDYRAPIAAPAASERVTNLRRAL